MFNSAEIFDSLSNILVDSLREWNCDAHVYLFMPDHCHLLIQGNTDDSDLLGFMKNFKQRSGYWFSTQAKACGYQKLIDGSRNLQVANVDKIRWQKDFYDHILRKEEDINKQVYYILGNPLRRRIVSNWKEYPFKGSTIHDFKEW